MADTLLAQAVRAQRALEKLTQEDLAAKLGISRQTVGNVERGGMLQHLVAEKFASWLGSPKEQVLQAARIKVEE